MHRKFFISAVIVLAVAGCSSPRSRMNANPAALAGVDAATQEKIRQGEIAVGYSGEMVEMALGRPVRVIKPTSAGGDTVWLYRDAPRNENDYIRAGYRRRVVFDPVRRSNVIIVEYVGDRVFPRLRSHTIRVTLRENRVVAIEQVEDV